MERVLFVLVVVIVQFSRQTYADCANPKVDFVTANGTTEKCATVCPPQKTTSHHVNFCRNNCPEFYACLKQLIYRCSGEENTSTGGVACADEEFFHYQYGFCPCIRACEGLDDFCLQNCPDCYASLTSSSRPPNGQTSSLATTTTTSESLVARKTSPVSPVTVTGGNTSDADTDTGDSSSNYVVVVVLVVVAIICVIFALFVINFCIYKRRRGNETTTMRDFVNYHFANVKQFCRTDNEANLDDNVKERLQQTTITAPTDNGTEADPPPPPPPPPSNVEPPYSTEESQGPQ